LPCHQSAALEVSNITLKDHFSENLDNSSAVKFNLDGVRFTAITTRVRVIRVIRARVRFRLGRAVSNNTYSGKPALTLTLTETSTLTHPSRSCVAVVSGLMRLTLTL